MCGYNNSHLYELLLGNIAQNCRKWFITTKCGAPHEFDQVGIEESSGGAVHLPKHSFSPTPHTSDALGMYVWIIRFDEIIFINNDIISIGSIIQNSDVIIGSPSI